MNRSELIESLKKRLTHIPEKDSVASVKCILKQMSEVLCQSGRIEIRNFGSFCLHDRASQKMRNPKTGESILKKETRLPYFKPGKALRKRVDDSREKVKIQGEDTSVDD